MTIQDIYQNISRTVVKVLSIGKVSESGSGFIISKEGYILTCYHVIDKAEKIQIITSDQKIISGAYCVGFNKECDVAILKTDISFEYSLALGASRDLKSGNKVLALGYPLIHENRTESTPSVFETTVSNFNPVYFTLKGIAGLGSSGGPVFDIEQNAAVGIISKELSYITIKSEAYPTGDLTFAVPVHRFEDLVFDLVRVYQKVESKEKQNQFKNKIADLYSAQGFEVKTNLSIGAGQIIDIYAKTRLGGSLFCVAIQCLYKSSTIDVDDVKAFYTNLLISKTPTLPIHKGIIVSNANFSLEAQELATRSDLDLVNYQDLSRQMVDFQSYLHDAIREYEGLPFFNYLIDSPCSTYSDNYDGVVINSLFDYVRNIIQTESHSKIAILGNFGMGKTVFGQKLTAYLASKYLELPTENRIPIHVELKSHKAGTRIEETIVQTMQIQYGLNWDIRSFSFLKRTGQLVFILDGLDEMAAKVDRVAVNENLREIIELADGNNALIFTCRTHFFFNTIDEAKLHTFKTIYLLPWRSQELVSYLNKRFPENSGEVLSRIQKIFNLEELAQTPIFLEMIVSTLQKIEDTTHQISSSDLYEYYTQQWISQQEIRRGSVLSYQDKETLIESLAFDMLQTDNLRIYYEDINALLRSKIGVKEENLAEVSNDIRTCSFLVRDTDYYRFSHTSFMEFFVAKKYMREIQSRKIEDFGKVYYKEEVFFFLQGLLNKHPEKGVSILKEFIKSCPTQLSRARIHTAILLGDICTSEAKELLWDILLNDPHSRVSGHAAEALYRNYQQKDAFEKLIDSLQCLPYTRDVSLPKEPNIGWYSVGGSRQFSVHDPAIARFFIRALRDPIQGDLNLKWYATSVLSRITNLRETIEEDDLRVLTDILLNDKLPRVRAYAAAILGNLAFSEPWIHQSLLKAQTEDDDPSVRKASETAINLLR